MYVRTKYGIIEKIEDVLEFDGTDYYLNSFHTAVKVDRETNVAGNKGRITKASYNITDLIEENDLVVIEYYVSRYRKRISRIFEVTKDGNKLYFDNRHCCWSYDLLKHKFLQAKGYNPKIKSVLTKEQFESMKYEV